MKVHTRNSKTGLCNICGASGTLTDDHVPPKGSVNARRVKLRTLSQYLQPPHPSIHRLLQNGVKFRSLCPDCNNRLLGQKYDPSLNQFSKKVAQILRVRDRITVPAHIDIECQPQLLVRAIVGHLLAAEIRKQMVAPLRSSPMLDCMREFFLDEAKDLSPDFRIYFWPYPATRQSILRGVGVLSGGFTIVGDFLKYFPVAFWLTYQAPNTVAQKLADREIPLHGCSISDFRVIRIPTRHEDTFRPDWPEQPSSEEILVVNDGVCYVADEA
jgi:hypothetical protein